MPLVNDIAAAYIRSEQRKRGIIPESDLGEQTGQQQVQLNDLAIRRGEQQLRDAQADAPLNDAYRQAQTEKLRADTDYSRGRNATVLELARLKIERDRETDPGRRHSSTHESRRLARRCGSMMHARPTPTWTWRAEAEAAGAFRPRGLCRSRTPTVP